MVTVRLPGKVTGHILGAPLVEQTRKQVWLRLCVLCWSQVADLREQGNGVVPAEEHQ